MPLMRHCLIVTAQLYCSIENICFENVLFLKIRACFAAFQCFLITSCINNINTIALEKAHGIVMILLFLNVLYFSTNNFLNIS